MIKKQYFVLIFILLQIVLTALPVYNAHATTITATLINEADGYPRIPVMGTMFSNPTVTVTYMGRTHILHYFCDRIRDYNLFTETVNDYTFSSFNTAPINTAKQSMKTMWYNQTGAEVYLRFYSVYNSTKLIIRDLKYNILTHAISNYTARYLPSPYGLSSETYWSLNYAHYIQGKIYSSYGNGTDYILEWNVNTGILTYHATGLGVYFAEPTSKTFEYLGQLYMFTGRHLAGDLHRYTNLNTFALTGLSGAYQNGGSPRSNIGVPLKVDTDIYTYYPLTGGGVYGNSINNKVFWYRFAPSTYSVPSKVGESQFTRLNTNDQQSVWSLYIVGKLSDGGYFGVSHLQNYAWFILNSDFTVREQNYFGNATGNSLLMHNAFPEYADNTNFPTVDTENKKLYILVTKENSAYDYTFQLYKIDFSNLNIAEYNDYGYFGSFTSNPDEPEIPTGGGVPTLNLFYLPLMLGSALGIGSTGGGLLLGIIVLISILLPFSLMRGTGIIVLIVALCAIGFLTYMGWFPFWILLLVSLLVAGLWALGMSQIFMGKG